MFQSTTLNAEIPSAAQGSIRAEGWDWKELGPWNNLGDWPSQYKHELMISFSVEMLNLTEQI